MKSYDGRLAILQRVLPAYRVPFFDLLAQSCRDGFCLYAGQSLPAEGITMASGLEHGAFISGRNLHWRDPSSRYYLCWQRGLTGWLAAFDPDTLIVELNPRLLCTRLALRWMKRRGRPVLGWGLGVPRLGNFLDRTFRLSLLRSLDGVLAYSGRGAREYRALGIQNVHTAFNAVSRPPGEKPVSRSMEIDHKPVVLFVGRLQARKRVDILLRACQELPRDLQPKLVIVGDGPDRQSFERLAAEVFPWAEFTGARHGDELIPYFQSADLFALPGTGGLAVQEAMSYGLPVLVAQGDGTQDDLVRSGNGWQVTPGDQEAFTTSLREALSDLVRLRRMGDESFRIVKEEINLEKMVDSFVGALVSVD